MERLGKKTQEARLRWFGHVRRTYDWYIGRNMLKMELSGRMNLRRYKLRFMDVVRESLRTWQWLK